MSLTLTLDGKLKSNGETSLSTEGNDGRLLTDRGTTTAYYLALILTYDDTFLIKVQLALTAVLMQYVTNVTTICYHDS